MSINDLEQAVLAAQERLRNAGAALALKHTIQERERVWEEYKLASAALINSERELAAAKGEQYAIPLDFPIRWDTGAPLPHLLMNDHRTFLTFYVNEPDPEWDATYVTVKHPADDSLQTLAVVEFKRCKAAKLGTPNDEVFHGHPLYHKGLEFYTAQLVQNSEWIAQLETINKVHRQYNPSVWQSLKHYIFWFHDSSFECIAQSFNVEIFHTTMSDLIVKVGKLLIE